MPKVKEMSKGEIAKRLEECADDAVKGHKKELHGAQVPFRQLFEDGEDFKHSLRKHFDANDKELDLLVDGIKKFDDKHPVNVDKLRGSEPQGHLKELAEDLVEYIDKHH